MNEKFYARKKTILIDGVETVIPIVDNVPDNQKTYEQFRMNGMSHQKAVQIVEDLWQTRHYEKFEVINDYEGNFLRIPVYSTNEQVQEKYRRLRYLGESHNSADMVITGQSPGIGLTDSTLLKYDLLHNQFTAKFQGERGDALAKEARKLGISTTGKFYHPGIAAKFGDPEAWVGSVDDVKDVCKRRGWSFKVTDGHMDIGITADLGKSLPDQYCNKPLKVGS